MHSDKRRIQLNGNLMFKTSCVFKETQKICCSNYGWQCQVGSERQNQSEKKSFICVLRCGNKRTIYRMESVHESACHSSSDGARTNTRKKKWQLVKLCVNWKAVKSGLICMDTKHVGMNEHAAAGVKVTMNQSFGMAFASIVLSVYTYTSLQSRTGISCLQKAR